MGHRATRWRKSQREIVSQWWTSDWYTYVHLIIRDTNYIHYRVRLWLVLRPDFMGMNGKKKEIILWLNLCSALSWNLNIFLKWQMGCTNNEVWDLFIVHNVWKYIYTVRKLWKFFLKYKMFSEVNYSPKMQKKWNLILC